MTSGTEDRKEKVTAYLELLKSLLDIGTTTCYGITEFRTPGCVLHLPGKARFETSIAMLDVVCVQCLQSTLQCPIVATVS